MACVVAVVDHTLFDALLEVSVTLPVQNVNGPLAEMVGVAGAVLTVTTVAAEVAEQVVPLLAVTV